jgi:Ras family protein T1
VPVILCGNKIDLRGGEVTNQDLEQEIMPIMNEFKVRSTDGLRGAARSPPSRLIIPCAGLQEVETCVETSARTMLNVTEVIFFALKAVCYPLAPLYDSREHVRPSAITIVCLGSQAVSADGHLALAGPKTEMRWRAATDL